jgi:hypothetical protein
MLNNRRKSFGPIDALVFGFLLFMLFADKKEKDTSEELGWGWVPVLIWLSVIAGIFKWRY